MQFRDGQNGRDCLLHTRCCQSGEGVRVGGKCSWVGAQCWSGRDGWRKEKGRRERGTLRERLRKIAGRTKRMRVIRRAAAKQACNIFVAGPRAAAAYGTEVWGLSDDQVQKLRRAAGSAVKPGGRIRSLRMALLVAGMPTATTEVAPILQLSRMVWKGVVSREEAHNRGSSLADILRWWEDAKPYIEDVLKADGEGRK